LDDTTKEYTVFAIDLFRCFISVEDACPDSATENAFVRRAWNGACEEMGEHLTLTPTVAKLVRLLAARLRSFTKILPDYQPRVPAPWGVKNKDTASHRCHVQLQERSE
jgi:hypothetical protein